MTKESPSRKYSSGLDGKNVAWKGIRNLWEQRLLCDATLVAEGKPFQVHRSYLASCSEYFCSMFTGMFKERYEPEVEVHGVTAQGLEAVLHYMYTGDVDLNQDNITDVLEASSHLQILDVKKFCAACLTGVLSVDNCLRFLKLAELYSLDCTHQNVLDFILENFASVAEREEFCMISIDLLCGLLGNDSLHAQTELVVLKNALRWIKHDRERYQHAGRVIGHVRFGLITASDIEEAGTLISREPSLLPSCWSMLQGGMKYHMNLFTQPIENGPIAQPRSYMESILMFGGMNFDQCQRGEVLACAVDGANLVGFSTISQMQKARYRAGVTVLNNFVFVVGGEMETDNRDGSGSIIPRVSASAFRYNTRDGRWLQLASMSKPRSQFALIALPDCLLAFGGLTTSEPYAALDSIEKYDFERNEWVEKGRRRTIWPKHAACVCQDRVYISGGEKRQENGDYKPLNTVTCYTLDENSWEPKKPMRKKRCDHAMICHNNKLFVFGGETFDLANVRWKNVRETEYYDVISDQWCIIQPMPEGMSLGATLQCKENSVFILGGYNYDVGGRVDTIQRYNIDNDTWTVLQIKLPEPMDAFGAAIVKLPHTLYEQSVAV